MDYAHSIFYGTLVKASECDRATYREMGLQCALCNAGVFWAQGEHQQAHFRHFPDRGDPSCENRAKSMRAKDWEQKQRSIEHQYLKFLQANFWGIYLGVYVKMNLPALEKQIKLDERHPAFQEWWGKWRKAVRRNQDAVLKLATMMCQMINDGQYSIMNPIDPIANRHQGETVQMIERMKRFSQQSSTIGALGFLLNPRSEPMLKTLFFYAVYDYACYTEKAPQEFPPPFTPDLTKAFFLWVLTDIIGSLAAIPWAKATDEYRTHKRIPENMQSNIRPRLQGIRALRFLNAPPIF